MKGRGLGFSLELGGHDFVSELGCRRRVRPRCITSIPPCAMHLTKVDTAVDRCPPGRIVKPYLESHGAL